MRFPEFADVGVATHRCRCRTPPCLGAAARAYQTGLRSSELH